MCWEIGLENNINELKEEKNVYDHEHKERVRNIILSFLNKDSNILILESPFCSMLKKLLEAGINKITIPNHEEYMSFPKEYSKYVIPFSLGKYCGNCEIKNKFDLIWADFCGTWNTCKEELIPIFERELLNKNSTLIITLSMHDSGKNDLVKDVMNQLNELSKYEGYNLRLLNETGFSGNGTYTLFIKCDYATCPRCPKCSSAKTIKRGQRFSKFEVIQRYECKICDYKFSIDANRLRIPKNIRFFIYNKLKEGKQSSREISKEVNNKFNVKVSYVSIIRMFRDTKRYFGKEVKKRKVYTKIKIKSFERILNGKKVQHPETIINKEIIAI